MTSSVINVNNTFQQIFNIQVSGKYSLYIEEQSDQFCSGEIDIAESGDITYGYVGSVQRTLGININNPYTLPTDFTFTNHPERTYHIRKNSGYLEIKTVTGSNISVKFTLINTITLQEGSGVSVVNSSGTFTMNTTQGPNELLVTDNGTNNLVAAYTAGRVNLNSIITNIAAGTITLTPSISSGAIYVNTTNTVVSNTTGIFPTQSIPMALYSTNGSIITSITDARSFINNNGVGPTGQQGQGATGIQGLTGPTGIQGTNGSNGLTGPTGVQGSNGLTGPTGIQGTNGSNGSTGPTGIQGVQGVTGQQGQGVTGPTGTSRSGSMAFYVNSGSSITSGNVFLRYGTTTPTETTAQILLPITGTLKNLYINGSTGPQGSANRNVTIKLANAPGTTSNLTTLSVALTGTNTSASNLVDTVSVTAGQLISVYQTTTGVGNAPASAVVTAGFILE
jgi:hypothetical protein